MKILKDISIFILVLFLSYFSSSYVGGAYENIINDPGTFIDLSSLVGFPLSYIFFLCFLFTAFGGEKKYWWIGILLIPAIVIEFYFDLVHIYFPVALGFAGWLLGFAVFKFFPQEAIQK